MNKKKITEFLDINLTGDKLDQHMKEMLEEKFEHELKEKYSKILKSKYDVDRSDINREITTKKKSSLSYKYIIALLGLLLGGYFVANKILAKKAPDINQYLAMADNQLHYIGSDRGQSAVVPQNKVKAYDAFNKKEFKVFNELIATIEPLTIEDKFFMAYTKMYSKNYTEAYRDFNSLAGMMSPDQKYFQEIKLYKALCLLEFDKTKFDTLFQSLNDNSWAKKELNKILQ